MVLTGVVRENCSVTGSEVESAGFGVANENCSATAPLVEVNPLLGLLMDTELILHFTSMIEI